MKISKSDYVQLRCNTPEKLQWFYAAGGKSKFSNWARQLLTLGTIPINLPPKKISKMEFLEKLPGTVTLAQADQIWNLHQSLP